jgi:hypothetical protein
MTKKKNNKRTNNDLQSIAQKTKARTARTPLKPVDELGCSGEVVPDPHKSCLTRIQMSNYAAIPHAHIKCQIIQPRLMRIQLPYYAIIPHVFAQCQIKIPIPHMHAKYQIV